MDGDGDRLAWKALLLEADDCRLPIPVPASCSCSCSSASPVATAATSGQRSPPDANRTLSAQQRPCWCCRCGAEAVSPCFPGRLAGRRRGDGHGSPSVPEFTAGRETCLEPCALAPSTDLLFGIPTASSKASGSPTRCRHRPFCSYCGTYGHVLTRLPVAAPRRDLRGTSLERAPEGTRRTGVTRSPSHKAPGGELVYISLCPTSRVDVDRVCGRVDDVGQVCE